MVTRDGWSVSYTTGSGIDGVRLSVCRFPEGLGGRILRGDADGKKFETQEDAEQYAYEHGYLQKPVKPWCPRCRVRHTFLGKRSAFCQEHKIFTWEN